MNYFCHRSTPPMKTKSYSRIYRIIHWAIAICFTFLLLTIFLRMTWLNKFNIAEIIGDFLTTKNQQLSEEELIQLGKQGELVDLLVMTTPIAISEDDLKKFKRDFKKKCYDDVIGD